MSMWGIKGDLQMVELIFDFFKKINFKDWIIFVITVVPTVISLWISLKTEFSKTVFDRGFDNFKDRIKNKMTRTLIVLLSIFSFIVYIVAMLKIEGEDVYILILVIILVIFLVIAIIVCWYFKIVKNNYNKNIAKFFALILGIMFMLVLITLSISDNKKDVKDTATTSETSEANFDEEANKKIEKASKDSNVGVVIFFAVITLMLVLSLIKHIYRLLDDRKETIYFYDDKGKKIYIYRNLDNGYILCGYRPYMSIDNNNEYYKKLKDVKKTIKKSIKNTITVKDLNKKIDEILNYGRYISMEEIERKINYIFYLISLKDINKIYKSCNRLLEYCKNNSKVKVYSFEDLKDKDLYPMIWEDNK